MLFLRAQALDLIWRLSRQVSCMLLASIPMPVGWLDPTKVLSEKARHMARPLVLAQTTLIIHQILTMKATLTPAIDFAVENGGGCTIS
jgi:hypothetical protein